MITEKELKRQLKPFHSGVKKAKKLLPEILIDSEVIKWLSTGSYNNSKGLWVFTTNRIFFIDLKKKLLKECKYDKLTNISIDTGYLTSNVNLVIDSENIQISVDTSNFIIALDFLKDKINDEVNKNNFLHNYPELTEKMKKKSKYGSIICLIVIIFIVGSLFYSCAHAPSDSSNQSSDLSNQSSESTVQEKDKAPQQLSVDDKIKKICSDELGKRLINVEINDNAGKNDGSKVVLVHIKSDEAISKSSARTLMLKSIRDVMDKLYNADLPISEITTFTEGTMIDKYGKESQANVMKCTLKSETAAKIEWKNKDAIDFTQIFDNYWVTLSLRGK